MNTVDSHMCYNIIKIAIPILFHNELSLMFINTELNCKLIRDKGWF